MIEAADVKRSVLEVWLDLREFSRINVPGLSVDCGHNSGELRLTVLLRYVREREREYHLSRRCLFWSRNFHDVIK